MDWKVRTKRFVLFYDILGFKDLVARNEHTEIIKKLESLSDSLKKYSNEDLELVMKDFDVKKDQTHTVIFSDSVFVFTKSDKYNDACAILGVAHAIHHDALSNGLAIKGAISFGDITVDKEKSIFFGQPIIDAFLLQEDLQLLSVLIDHKAESKFMSFTDSKLPLKKNLFIGDVPMKYGKVIHMSLRPSDATISERKDDVKKLYLGVSGKPRQYFDNTIKYYNSITEKN